MIVLSLELLYIMLQLEAAVLFCFFLSFKDLWSKAEILKHFKFGTLMFPILNYSLIIKNKINFGNFNVTQSLWVKI